MAAVTPGAEGTCKSATAEGQLQEILSFLSLKQLDIQVNPGEASNILAIHDQGLGLFSGTFDLPVGQSISSGGALTLTAATYLVGSGFQVGTGGTFKSSAPEAYALEVLMYLQGLEQVSANNPDNRNYITGTYNSDTGRYQGSFSLPITYALDAANGAVEYTADEYLTT